MVYDKGMEKILIIAGPTGVGKSDFAELLAEKIDGVIINADQAQLYTHISIGTAKPDWERKPMEHYLFDHINEPKAFSNHAYQKTVREIIQAVQKKGKKAIIVGGSGFYYQSLLFEFGDLTIAPPLIPAAIEPGYPENWEHLKEIDPERAAALHRHDHYRIKRALSIFYTYGILPSKVGMIYKPWAPYTLVHINREKTDLYERINKRTEIMLKQGWINETAELPEPWKDFVCRKKIIGYEDILKYVRGTMDYDLMVKMIQKKTRNYAKKQQTFFKSLTKKIPVTEHIHVTQVNLTLSSVDLYLNHLIKQYIT